MKKNIPTDFDKYISDKKVKKAFIRFAKYVEKKSKDKKTQKDFSELTRYGSQWSIGLGAKLTNPDDIGTSTYKLMRKDAQIQMGLKALKMPIKAMKWWVECSDKNLKAFLEFALKKVWKSNLNVILNALDFGYSISEKIWEVKDIIVERKENNKTVIAFKGQAVLLKKLKDPDPKNLSILTDDMGDFNGFKQSGGGSSVEVSPEKSFVFTNEKEYGNLYGKSLLRYAYDYWYWAVLMYQFLNRYMERRGTPPVKGRAPKGKTELSSGAVKDNLFMIQNLGESLTESSVVSLPSTIDDKGNYVWDVEYMKDDQRADMFISYIQHLNAMKLRALFVPERMVIQDTEMGARAVAKTHLSVFLMGLEGLIESIVDHYNKYLIPQLIKYNFGDNTTPAYIKTGGLSLDAKNLLKQILVAVIKKSDGNVPLDLVKSLEELELPIKDFDEKEDKKEKDKKQIEDEDLEKVYNCECLKCGYKVKTASHCRDLKCKKCGGEMRRSERPGVGFEIDTEKDIREEVRLSQIKALLEE